jgi:hypothetical protein
MLSRLKASTTLGILGIALPALSWMASVGIFPWVSSGNWFFWGDILNVGAIACSGAAAAKGAKLWLFALWLPLLNLALAYTRGGA